MHCAVSIDGQSRRSINPTLSPNDKRTRNVVGLLNTLAHILTPAIKKEKKEEKKEEAATVKKIKVSQLVG